MRNLGNTAFRLTTICASVMAACGLAMAQEDAAENPAVPESSVSIGLGNWSQDRRQQGIFDGMRDSGVYGLFDLDIAKRNAATGTWLTLSGRNLGLDTRELRAEWLRQGNIGAFIEYGRTPRDNPYTFNTGLQGIGSNTLVVSGAGANALPFSQIELGTRRDLTHVGFYKNLVPGLDFRLSFKNEEKDGTRQWGRGGSTEFAVEPIDSTTRHLEAKLEFSGERLQLSGGYYGNWYNNNIAPGYVDTRVNGGNQAFTGAGVTRYALSLPLDNEAHQVFLNGGYNFTHTTRGTFKLQYTQATQNEHLPTQDIPGLSLAGSPQSLNGEINTTLVQLGLTARPTSQLSVLANLRYHDMRDKMPQARFVKTTSTGHVCDSTVVNNIVCVDNTPLSFKTTDIKLEGTYRLPLGYSAVAGADFRRQDRTVPMGAASTLPNGADDQRYVPFRAKVEEDTYRMQLRRAMSETVNGAIAFLHSRRDGSAYNRTNEAESDEINPIHISDRQRNKWRLSLDWTPVEPLSIQFNVEDARDRYTVSAARPYGLRDGSAVLYSVDASYAINDNWQINAWYARDKTQATQFGQRATNGGAAAAEKDARLEDTGDSFGIGTQGRVGGKTRIGADFQWIRNTNRYPESLTLAGAGSTFPVSAGQTVIGPLPDIENKLTRLKFFATYAAQKNAELRFDFIHERWTTNDWSWLFADGTPYTYTGGTAPNFFDGTTVTQSPKQTSNFLGIRYIYRFQ